MKRAFTAIAIVVTIASPLTFAADDPLPRGLMTHTRAVCAEYKVDIAVILAIMECESGFDIDAAAGGCHGLMQLHNTYAAHCAADAGIAGYDRRDPYHNITVGVYILAGYLEKYGDYSKALIAYNCGEFGARALFALGVTKTGYSRKVLGKAADYEKYRERLPRVDRPRNREGRATE